MLMKTKLDYFHVEPQHDVIDKRLENWAQWVAVRRPSWVSPMFRMARSNTRQWHAPEVKAICDTLDAAAMEKAVYALPVLHRDAIRWCYVYRFNAEKFRKMHGLTTESTMRLIKDGRQMLINRAH